MQVDKLIPLVFKQTGWLLLFAAFCWTGCVRPKDDPAPLPGLGPILILDIDTLRADHLG